MCSGLYVCKGKYGEILYSILNSSRGYVIVDLTNGFVNDHRTFDVFDEARRELLGPLRARELRVAITDIVGVFYNR
jgi:hypothetical protein